MKGFFKFLGYPDIYLLLGMVCSFVCLGWLTVNLWEGCEGCFLKHESWLDSFYIVALVAAGLGFAFVSLIVANFFRDMALDFGVSFILVLLLREKLEDDAVARQMPFARRVGAKILKYLLPVGPILYFFPDQIGAATPYLWALLLIAVASWIRIIFWPRDVENKLIDLEDDDDEDDEEDEESQTATRRARDYRFTLHAMGLSTILVFVYSLLALWLLFQAEAEVRSGVVAGYLTLSVAVAGLAYRVLLRFSTKDEIVKIRWIALGVVLAILDGMILHAASGLTYTDSEGKVAIALAASAGIAFGTLFGRMLKMVFDLIDRVL